MGKIFFSIICINFIFICSALCLEIPEDLTSEVIEARKNGKILFNIYSKGPAKDKEILKKIDEAKNKITDFCDFEYKAYALSSKQDIIIYFIAEPPSQDYIVFGRHYKVAKGVVIPSTKSCFISSAEPPDKNVVGVFTTHLLSDTPTEFHVFLSLKHKKPIYVVTSRGIWKVELDKIEFLEKRE